MEIVNVDLNNVKLFSNVLTESAKWLDSLNKSMWKVKDLTVEELLKNMILMK